MKHRRLVPLIALVAALGLGLAPSATGAAPTRSTKASSERRAAPLVIGHRGASGYRPEHTLAAYDLAIRQGADFIGPDLVSTSDGVLVARHENEIAQTTDVEDHPGFADRHTTKTIDGRRVTGWFTEDFTLAELKTLRATERLPGDRPQNTAYDGLYPIPTLQEVVDLARARSTKSRVIGIYPETKHPTYFDSIGLSLEEPLVATLAASGLDKRSSAVLIQSFEVSNLRDLDTRTKVRLVQLLDDSGQPYDLKAAGQATTYRDLTTRAGMKRIATYADGVGPNKNLVIPRRADGTLGAPTALVRTAHEAGLEVHPWTFRVENQFLPAEYRSSSDLNAPGDLAGEIRTFLATGIDGFFTDNPDIGDAVRDRARRGK